MKAVIGIGALAAATALAAQGMGDPRAQLAAAQAQAGEARARSAQMDSLSRVALDAAERARAVQAALAARIQASESDIAAAEARLAIVRAEQREQERRLAAREQPIARLVAALETMARRPAAATLVQPGSLNDLVHVRAVLSSMAPRIADQTADLRAELAQARNLRRQAASSLATLRESRHRGQVEQQRLAQLEIQQRRRSAALAMGSRAEAERALGLGENARDLEDLVRRLGAEGSVRERLASLPGPLPRPAHLTEALPAEPAPAGPQRVVFRLPVLGPVVRGFGETLPSGARSRGIGIAARDGAIVLAPAAGRVIFAGPYRDYGAIAIMDHGHGFTSLVAGLSSSTARIGDTVEQGSPIGRAGAKGVTIELRQAGQPVDLTTFVG